MRPGARPTPHPRDERGLVGKAAVVMLLLIVLVGLALIEGGSILFARIQIHDVASAAASEGAAVFRDSRSTEQARNAALALVEDRDDDARLTRFRVEPDGHVTVTLKKRARTFLVSRVSFLKHLAVVKATETAGAPSL